MNNPERRIKRLPNASSSQENWSSRLREARLVTGKTLSELAQELGISKTMMSRYELGDAEPSFAALLIWCAYLNMSLNWVFYGALEAPLEAPGIYRKPTKGRGGN